MAKLLAIFISFHCVGFCMAQGTALMSPEKLARLMPKKIDGFTLVEQDKGRMIKIGTLTYSMAECTFSKSKRKISILLFDYNNAPIMYRQATSNWETQQADDSETLFEQSLQVADWRGWQQYNKASNSSKILLGIYDRFYLVLNGEGVDLEILNRVMDLFPWSDFPALQLEYTNAKHR
ncbi:MAG: hypothetical protein KF687_14890 [Cyclobacteriaceae bacterium]|nr:hypothetical protein [Cyclobacteriaceae bacterium]